TIPDRRATTASSSSTIPTTARSLRPATTPISRAHGIMIPMSTMALAARSTATLSLISQANTTPTRSRRPLIQSPLTQDEKMMREALIEAEKALEIGEVPIGAVVIKDGAVIGRGHNLRETTNDPTAHAEVIALREAAQRSGSWRLTGCELYVTIEPCPMCAGAIILARIDRVVYGAADPKAGAVDTLYRLLNDSRFNHQAE